MKINLDRLQKLAGIKSTSSTLNEASNRSFREDQGVSDEVDYRFGGENQLAEADDHEDKMEEEEEEVNEAKDEMEEEDMDEMIEVDEKMLVQEIRRAKKLMAEAVKKSKAKKEKLVENNLRKIISEEIDQVFKDLNLTSGWVYGKNKPTNRHKGAVNTAFPGVGFKKRK